MQPTDSPLVPVVQDPPAGAPVGPSSRPPILSLSGISVTFGGVRALDGVDFTIGTHEIIALVGENAAGKSTLAKVIAGVYHPSAGVICSDGQPVVIGSPLAATRLGIATVFQELALADNLD